MVHSFETEDLVLFNNEQYSDAVVKCGTQIWHVHKIVICTRSQWFRNALDGDFKESQEAAVVIEEREPHHIEWLLKYLYSGSLWPTWRPTVPLTDVLLIEYSNLVECGLDANFFVAVHKAHELANYFVLDRLKTALEKMMAQKLAWKAAECQQNHSPFRRREFNMEKVNQTLDPFSDDFFDAISLIYRAEYPNGGLRQILVDFGVRSRYVTLQHGAFLEGLRKEATYGTDILIATTMDGADAEWDRPSSCNRCSLQLWKDGRHLIHLYTRDAEAARHGCSSCLGK